MPVPTPEMSGFRIGYLDAMMGPTAQIPAKTKSAGYPPVPQNITDFKGGAGAKEYRKGWARGFKKGKSDKAKIEAQNRQTRREPYGRG